MYATCYNRERQAKECIKNKNALRQYADDEPINIEQQMQLESFAPAPKAAIPPEPYPALAHAANRPSYTQFYGRPRVSFRNMSMTSDISALAIDWENLDDLDYEDDSPIAMGDGGSKPGYSGGRQAAPSGPDDVSYGYLA
jgi:hypothetical protein